MRYTRLQWRQPATFTATATRSGNACTDRRASWSPRPRRPAVPARRRLIEVGCGVGAQTEILLRHFPDLHVTGVDASEPNLAAARESLASLPWLEGR